MRHTYKKLLSVLMAFVMAFSFSLTALAVDEGDQEEKEQQIEVLEQEKDVRRAQKRKSHLWIPSYPMSRHRLKQQM